MVFLEEWKTTILWPLLKKVIWNLLNLAIGQWANLPFISKLVEQAFMNQFNTHCDLNGTTLIHQSAYKQFHSCDMALIKIVNDALWAKEQKNITILVVKDLTVTFDIVDHTVLLEAQHKCSVIWTKVLKVLYNRT